MPTCPECGLPDQEGSCAHCGTVLDDSSTHTDGERGEQPVSPADAPPDRGHQEPQQSAEGTADRKVTPPENGSSADERPPEQGAAAIETPPEEGAATGETAGEGSAADETTVTRRKLLAGGAGVTAAAAGGYWFFTRGPTGAKAVAHSYIDAINDNDWTAAGSLFHEESPPMVGIEETSELSSYEEYLQQEGQLTRLEELSPSVDEIIQWRHVPDFTAEAAESLLFGVQADAADQIVEAKQLSVIVEVSIEALSSGDGERTEHLAGDTTKSSISATVVKGEAGASWSLWQARSLF
jgi:hypothetical protein